MSDIGRFQKWTKIWEVGYVPWPQHTAKGKDFELTPTAKMETGHPEEGYFGREFRVICNHCGVKAAWSRNTCKFWAIFAFFSKRRPLTVNFQNSVPKVFTASLIDVVVFKFREKLPTGNRRNRALFTGPKTNKISAACQTVATARIAPKVCQGQPPTMCSQCSRLHPNRFTFSGVIAERTDTVLAS